MRDLATTGEVYVVTGPLDGRPVQRIGPDGVVVPAATWKAIYMPARRYADAWICTNVQGTVCREESVARLDRQLPIDLIPVLAPARLR